MIIRFILFRSRYPEEVVTNGELEYPIEDTVLISLDSLISKLIKEYALKMDIVRRNGLAYIGSTKITEIEINDKDDFELNEQGFKEFVKGIFTNVEIKWAKTNSQKAKSEEKEDVNG